MVVSWYIMSFGRNHTFEYYVVKAELIALP